MQVLLVLCLLAVPPVLGQVSDDCMYSYVEQPQSEPDCNPYEGVLQLRCRTVGPLDTFSVEWYQVDFAGMELMLDATVERTVRVERDPPLSQISSELQIASGDVVPAQYWCQIRVNGQLLRPSRRITIQNAAFYNGGSLSACSGSNDQSNGDAMCADIDQSPSFQPTSTTVDSSTSSPPSSPVSLATHTPAPMFTHTPTHMPTSTGTPPEGDEDPSTGSNASFETLYVVIAVTAVLAIVVLIVSITIPIVVWRRRKLKGSASLITRPQQQPCALSVGHNHPPSPVEMAEYEDPDSVNPVYYNLVPEGEKREEEKEGGYQSLNPETVDYISMYVTADIQRKGPPLVEVGGKEYCIIDKTKLDPPSLYGTAESL